MESDWMVEILYWILMDCIQIIFMEMEMLPSLEMEV